MTAPHSLPRLTQQIIRNSIADNVADMAPSAVIRWGSEEYFEMWGTSFPYDDAGVFILHLNSAFNDAERTTLQHLVDVLNEAAPAADHMTAEAFVASEWAARIDDAAKAAFAAMSCRGRFSEEQEEAEPSLCF